MRIMSVKKIEQFETPWFHSSAMFIGGYINAFTFVTRNEFMANNQTSNITKLGIFSSQNELYATMLIALTLLTYFLGSFCAVSIKNLIIQDPYDWKVFLIYFEMIVFTILGILPIEASSTLDFSIRMICVFLSAVHLTGFRTMDKQTLNSTICTGNIRTSGEMFSNALCKKSKASLYDAIKYTGVLLFFPLGAYVCIKLAALSPTRSIWICAVICLVQLIVVSPKKEVVNELI